MPIIWRYLLRHFIQVFALCVGSFVAMLLVLRFQDIARFAAAGTSHTHVLLFAFLQIPYIVPIAIPVSCLIAGLLLFQRLSDAQELTAFRSSGISLSSIALPLIFAGLFLSLANWTVASEIAPRCRAISKSLVYHAVSTNPLLLFQKNSPIKFRNAFVDIKALKSGKSAEEIVFAIKNNTGDRLMLLVANRLFLKGSLLKGENVTLISSADPQKGDNAFDHLIIENQSTMDTQASYLSQYTQNADWDATYEYSALKQILTREKAKAKEGRPPHVGKKARLEIAKRISLAMAALTFTCIGVACGIQIGRNRSRKRGLWALGLAAFYLTCFIAAKSLRHHPSTAIWMYLTPHLLILFICSRLLKSAEKGSS